MFARILLSFLAGTCAGLLLSLLFPRSTSTDAAARPVRPSLAQSSNDRSALTSTATGLPVTPPASRPVRTHVTPVPLAGSIATLAPGAQTLLAEQIALRQLAADTALELTAEQWTAFAHVSAACQELRLAYEATIAAVTARERGYLRAEVPVYPAAGDALRTRFEAELRAQLGSDAAERIARTLGGKLDGYFGGFGVAAQTLEFAHANADADGTPTPEDLEITRTLVYWNSATATDRLTRRRETHLPAVEDPASTRWQPFLALL